jgi:hypothetical protein
MLRNVDGSLRPAFKPELLQYLRHMVLHGLVRDVEAMSRLLVG